MAQIFSRPDVSVAPTGHLSAAITTWAVPDAPAFLRGVRALFVADVHAVPATTRADCLALRHRIEAIAPDLLLFGGDYADRPEDCRRLFEGLAGLRPPLGWFGVLGNNDREAWPKVKALRGLMAEAGCTLLVNQHKCVPVGEGTLWIGGVDEYLYGKPKPEKACPPERAPGVYSILLSHYPKAEPPLPDLILSGHTHGGQYNLLGVTPYTLGFERLLRPRLAPRWVAGACALGQTRLLVSKGIGASRIPLRVGVRPEINLITF